MQISNLGKCLLSSSPLGKFLGLLSKINLGKSFWAIVHGQISFAQRTGNLIAVCFLRLLGDPFCIKDVFNVIPVIRIVRDTHPGSKSKVPKNPKNFKSSVSSHPSHLSPRSVSVFTNFRSTNLPTPVQRLLGSGAHLIGKYV